MRRNLRPYRPELFLMGLTICILVRALFRMFSFLGKIFDLVIVDVGVKPEIQFSLYCLSVLRKSR